MPAPLRCVYPIEKRSVQRVPHSLAFTPECLLAQKIPCEVYVYRMVWIKAYLCSRDSLLVDLARTPQLPRRYTPSRHETPGPSDILRPGRRRARNPSLATEPVVVKLSSETARSAAFLLSPPRFTCKREGDRRGSNPRPSEPQSDALPTELRPPRAKGILPVKGPWAKLVVHLALCRTVLK
jgi:hypothetical protein